MKSRKLLRALALAAPLIAAACGGREAEKLNGPVITLTGESEVELEVNLNYEDEGATAHDDEDGDLTNQISSTGDVDVNSPSVYIKEFNVTDSDGNQAETVSRTITIYSRPVITLIGDDEVVHELNTPYLDAGASVYDEDDESGDLDSYIVVESDLDIQTSAEYEVRYNVTDTDGHAADQVTRSVTVSARPVITLLGQNNLHVEFNTPYEDAGASAWDQEDMDLSDQITVENPVDTALTGQYLVSYGVIDSDGLSAVPVTRTVRVFARPVLTLNGPQTIHHLVSTPYIDAGASAFDQEDGDITANITSLGEVDVDVPGPYVLAYEVQDSEGYAADRVIRLVVVVEPNENPPLITLEGDAEVTIDVNTVYIDPGATAFDQEDGDLTDDLVVSGNVDSSSVGQHVLSYNVTDSDGNEAVTVFRTVNVSQPNTIPVITLIGPDEVTASLDGIYDDEGATAFDEEDGDISSQIVTTGAVDTSAEGQYILSFDVVDSHGESAITITRTVNVIDTDTDTPPVLTLLGEEEVSVEQDEPYLDAGATAFDQEDEDISSDILVTGSVDTSTPGDYVITYNVTDSDGNEALPISRNVTVFIPVIFTYEDPLMLGTVSLDSFSNFPEVGGATGTYSIAPALPEGLSIDAATGELSGIAAEATPRTSYTVTGVDGHIIGTAVVDIELLALARFAYAANSHERTISIFKIDADSGRLLPHSYHFMTDDATGNSKGMPLQLEAHPSGEWLFASTSLDGLIVYAVEADGSLTYTTGTYLGAGAPHAITLSSDGSLIYAGGTGSTPLRTFNFNSSDGSLAQVGAPISTSPVHDLALSRDGSRLVTVDKDTMIVRSWSADSSGALTSEDEFTSLLGDVGELSLSGDGASVYLPLSGAGFDLIVRLAIDEAGLITLGENRPAPTSSDQVNLHPDGSAAYVASTATGEVRLFPLDLNSGELGLLGDSETALLGELSDLRIGAAGRWMHVSDLQAGEVGHIQVDQLTASLSLGSDARARLGAADAPVIIRGNTAAVSEPVALYVSCGSNNSLEAFAVDPLTGALSFLQTTPTQSEPHDLVVGNTEERLYLANSGDNSISTFQLNSDDRLGTELGSLNLIGPPTSITLESSGRFLYSIIAIGKRVYGFEIKEEDGTLRALLGEGGGIGVNASSLVADPTGRFLYCASKGEAPYNVTWENGGNPGVITVLSIDAETGVPIPLDESVPGTVLVPFSPDFVTFDPSGARAYTNQTTSTVRVAVPLDVSHADGDGTIIVPGTVTADAPTAIEIGSSGRFAWVSTSDGLGGGELQLYDISENGSLVNAAAGDFTPRAIYSDVADPAAITSDSNERFLYVLNRGTELISVWEIDASDGTLTKLSEITTGADPVAIHLNERF